MFEQYKEKVKRENNAVEKRQGKFDTVMFTVQDANGGNATASVSKDCSQAEETIIIRVLTQADDAFKYLKECNAYNANSCGPIAFISGDRICVSVTDTNPTEQTINAHIAELLIVNSYIRRA